MKENNMSKQVYRYCKKDDSNSVPFNAIQYNGENWQDILNFCPEAHTDWSEYGLKLFLGGNSRVYIDKGDMVYFRLGYGWTACDKTTFDTLYTKAEGIDDSEVKAQDEMDNIPNAERSNENVHIEADNEKWVIYVRQEGNFSGFVSSITSEKNGYHSYGLCSFPDKAKFFNEYDDAYAAWLEMINNNDEDIRNARLNPKVHSNFYLMKLETVFRTW